MLRGRWTLGWWLLAAAALTGCNAGSHANLGEDGALPRMMGRGLAGAEAAGPLTHRADRFAFRHHVRIRELDAAQTPAGEPMAFRRGSHQGL